MKRVCAGCDKPITAGSKWISSELQDSEYDGMYFHDFECFSRRHAVDFYEKQLTELENINKK